MSEQWSFVKTPPHAVASSLLSTRVRDAGQSRIQVKPPATQRLRRFASSYRREAA